jgi:hypothetical protein
MKKTIAIMAFLLLGCSTLDAAPPTIQAHRGTFLDETTVILEGISFGFWPGRVVIGNRPLYSECNFKIKQKIVSWKNKAIIITVDQDVFRWGEIGYVFVVSPSWWFLPPVVSWSYAITFGTGAGI